MIGAHFADKVRRHVGRVAELAAHLQVAGAANGIPQFRQPLGAHEQQRHVGSDVAKLRGGAKC